jgi:hypothetical protein
MGRMRNGFRALCACAAAALAACGTADHAADTAPPPGWEVLVEGDGGQISVAPDRVEPLGDGVYRVWLRDTFLDRPKLDVDGRPYRAFVVRWELDCRRGLARLVTLPVPETMIDRTATHPPPEEGPWEPATRRARTQAEHASFCAWARENGV